LRPTAKTTAAAVQATSEAELARLHAKIGQLVIEQDILSKTFGR
jgi:transposase